MLKYTFNFSNFGNHNLCPNLSVAFSIWVMTALILHVCCTHYTYFILRNVVFFGYSCCRPSVRICLMISNELYCLLESKSALRNHYWLWIPKFSLFKWSTILWKRVRTTSCWLFNLLGINENEHCTVMSAYAIASHSCLALGMYVHEKKGLPLLTLTNIIPSGLPFSLVGTTVRDTGNITESTVGTFSGYISFSK